jgi:catechol 2,3-dioxygenase-like lactoylglutathione lyase family enzyme
MRFRRVGLQAAAGCLPALSDFYGSRLGLELETSATNSLSLAIGETALEFAAGPGQPFYHFALLVPGDRFGAALEWAGARTQLLPKAQSSQVVFDFEAWSACACYFHDPAGNIVELIAHRGLAESGAPGEFRAGELVGLSELGLVGDPPAMAEALAERLGLELWDGTVDGPDSLAFVGERARTLILSRPGRGWLPTGRRAEPHPLEVVVSGRPRAELQLEDGRYGIRRI